MITPSTGIFLNAYILQLLIAAHGEACSTAYSVVFVLLDESVCECQNRIPFEILCYNQNK